MCQSHIYTRIRINEEFIFITILTSKSPHKIFFFYYFYSPSCHHEWVSVRVGDAAKDSHMHHELPRHWSLDPSLHSRRSPTRSISWSCTKVSLIVTQQKDTPPPHSPLSIIILQRRLYHPAPLLSVSCSSPPACCWQRPERNFWNLIYSTNTPILHGTYSGFCCLSSARRSCSLLFYNIIHPQLWAIHVIVRGQLLDETI